MSYPPTNSTSPPITRTNGSRSPTYRKISAPVRAAPVSPPVRTLRPAISADSRARSKPPRSRPCKYHHRRSSAKGQAHRGTIGDFELFGEGVPLRAVYKTRIFDSGTEGQLRPLLLVGYIAADGGWRAGGGHSTPRSRSKSRRRTGIDPKPDIYYEFTDMGTRVPVSQQRYQDVLKNPSGTVNVNDGQGGALTLTTHPKPGNSRRNRIRPRQLDLLVGPDVRVGSNARPAVRLPSTAKNLAEQRRIRRLRAARLPVDRNLADVGLPPSSAKWPARTTPSPCAALPK